MPNIDERVVSMQFDNKDFDPKLKKSQKTFEEFEESLSFDKGSKALKNFEKNMDKFDTKPMSDKLGALGKAFSAFETVSVGALLSVGNRLENFINRALKMTLTEGAAKGWGDYAEKVTATQTIMAATASQFKDTNVQIEAVNSQLDDLRTFADETSFSFKDMTSNIGKFTSQGIDLRTSVRAMEGISTWAALSGANTWEASRAYYNLSQALGTGAVTLIDWRSIVNANMATAEFKKTALEAAKAAGTLKEQADGTYKTLQGHTVTIANFNQNLNDRWLTSGVLLSSLDVYGKFSKEILEYTNQMKEVSVRDAMRWIDEYADGTKKLDEILALAGDDAKLVGEMVAKLSTKEYDLGRRAFRAAQETKTFAEALNYTKEAVATGWSQTWELIFGDYNEARKFWTDVTDVLYELFVKGGEFRNKVLELWSKTFGRKDFMAALKALRDFFLGTDEKKGFLGYIQNAWTEVFPFLKNADSLASALVRITKSFREWAEGLKLTEEQAETLRSVVKFLARAIKFAFSLIKSIWIFVSPFLRWTKELLSSLSGLFRAILDGTGAILVNQKALEAFRLILLGVGAAIALPIKLIAMLINWLRSLGDKTLPQVIDELRTFWGNIVGFFKRLGNKFVEVGGNIVRGFWTGFSKTWSVIVKALSSAFKGIVTLVKNIFRINSPSVVFFTIGAMLVFGFIAGLEQNFGLISKAFSGIGKFIKNFASLVITIINSLFNVLNSILMPVLKILISVLDILVQLLSKIVTSLPKILLATALIGLVLLAVKALIGIFNIISAAGKFAKGIAMLPTTIANFINGVSSALKTAAKAKMIQAFGQVAMSFAMSIVVLAAAFAMLASIDLPKIKQAAFIMGSMILVISALIALITLFVKKLTKGPVAVEENPKKGFLGTLRSVFRTVTSVDPESAAILDSIVSITVIMKNIAIAMAILFASIIAISTWMKKTDTSIIEVWSIFILVVSFMTLIATFFTILLIILRKTEDVDAVQKAIKVIIKAVRALIIAIGLLAGTFVLFSKIYDTLIGSIGAFALIVALITIFVFVLTKIGQKADPDLLKAGISAIRTTAFALALVSLIVAVLSIFNTEKLLKTVAIMGIISVILLVASAVLQQLGKKSESGKTIGGLIGIILGILALILAIRLLVGPLMQLVDKAEGIWTSIGVIAAIFGILLVVMLSMVGLGSLLTKNIYVLLGFVVVLAGLWSLVGMLLLLINPLKDIADSMKYFRDTIGAGALVVGLELLGFAALAALAGVLLAVATPFLILGGIGLLAFAGALILMGSHAKEIQAAIDIFRSFSWRTLGGIALFALGVLALGIAFRVLGLGALFAAGAFAAFTAAFIYMGKNIDWIKKAFEGFKDVTWEVVGGMAKLALGIAALSIALGILAIPLTAILIPIAGIIGLTNLLINSLIKLGEKVNLFAAAIDVVHEKLDKISTIIVAFGTALGSVAEPLKNFGYAALILGAGIIVMGAGIIVAAVGMLLLVGVLFLFKLVLDGIKRDHPCLYDTIMSIAEGLAEVARNGESIETMLARLLSSGTQFVSSWVDLFRQIPDVLNTALDVIKAPFQGLAKWMSGEHDTIKLMTAQAEANAKMTAAQADLAKALKDVDFEKLVQVMFRYNAAVRELGELASTYWKDMRLLSDGMNMLFYSMAADIIQGLLDGIEDKLAKLEGMSRRMARLIINTVKIEMDIRSPSHVMFELGQNIAEGEMNGADAAYAKAMAMFRSRHAQMVEIARDTATQMNSAYEKVAAASALAGIQAQFDALDMKMKTKGQTLTEQEWKDYYRLRRMLLTATKRYKETDKAVETGSKQSKDNMTFKDALSNIGNDIGSIWADLKSGKITFKEALSQLWGTIKTNGGNFLGDKFDQVKEWLIGDNGILSGFKDLLDPSKLFKSLDLENLLPKDDDDDPWKSMQDNFGQPADLSGLDNVSGSGQGSINTYEFVQNNYSPKALSRIEIYRQTNRQFNNFRTREVLAR